MCVVVVAVVVGRINKRRREIEIEMKERVR